MADRLAAQYAALGGETKGAGRKELLNERADALRRAEEFVTRRNRTEGDELTAEALFERVAMIDRQIEAIDRQAKGGAVQRRPNPLKPREAATMPQNSIIQNESRFADMFPNAAGDSAGWDSFGEFVGTIALGASDSRFLAISGGATSGVPADGGFTVPTAFYSELLDASLEAEIVRPRARVIPMSTKRGEFPIWDAFDHSAGAPFGFSLRWMGEVEQGTFQKPQLALIAMEAHDALIYAAASNRLIEDGVSFEEQLSEALRVSMSWGLDYAFLWGTGAGQPLGIFNSNTLVTVAKETGQAADTLNYSNLAKMAAAHVNYSRATWCFNVTAMPQLLELSIPIGTGGSHVPVLTGEGNDLRVLNRPAFFSEKFKPLGDLGDCLLADFSRYAVGLRKDADLAKSTEFAFDHNQTAWRLVSRIDGKPIDPEPETPRHGDDRSAFVTLAARA